MRFRADRAGSAVIAGGGSGIGRACALRLGSLGWQVILVGRTQAKLDDTAKAVTAAGGTVRSFTADVRDWDRLALLGRSLTDDGLDLLINCAGGQFPSPAALLSRNGWQSVIDVNLSGSFFLARHLHDALRLREGSVVNVVADLWQRAAPRAAHSGAARAGVISLVRSLAVEWASDGIRVNAVSPGLTDTEARRKHAATADKAEAVPLGRLAELDEVVDAILYLASARYVTGEVLTIDGGYWLK